MISPLTYRRWLPQDCIGVELAWDEGERVGTVHVPEEVATAAQTNGLPAPVETLRLESAVSLAMFLAMTARLPLILSGDLSAWDQQWGPLEEWPQRRRMAH